MTPQEKKEIEETMKYVGALTTLMGGIMAVLDEKIPDFRKELRSAIQRQQGNDPALKEQIDLALAVVDGLRHFVRN